MRPHEALCMKPNDTRHAEVLISTILTPLCDWCPLMHTLSYVPVVSTKATPICDWCPVIHTNLRLVPTHAYNPILCRLSYVSVLSTKPTPVCDWCPLIRTTKYYSVSRIFLSHQCGCMLCVNMYACVRLCVLLLYTKQHYFATGAHRHLTNQHHFATGAH